MTPDGGVRCKCLRSIAKKDNMKIDHLNIFKKSTLGFLDFDGEDMQNALEFFYTMLDESDFRAIVSLLNQTPLGKRKEVYSYFRKTFCVTDDEIHAKYKQIMKDKTEDTLIEKWVSNKF